MRKYKKSNRKGFELEEYIAEKLKAIDPNARPTKNSGASTEVGDIFSKYFYIECKQKLSKLNIIMDYRKEYLKLISQLPVESLKEIFIAIENKLEEKFIVIDSETFFRIVYKAYGGK